MSSPLVSPRVLDSAPLFRDDACAGSDSVLLVVANYTLPACTPALWRRATLRVVADGGANRLFDELPTLLPQLEADQARVLKRMACVTRQPAAER